MKTTIETVNANAGAYRKEEFEGTVKEAEKWVRNWYGRAPRVERSEGLVVFRYVGFSVFIQ